MWLGENREGKGIRNAIQSSRLVRLGKQAPIETRTQYNRRCKEKNFVRIEGNDELAG